MNDSNPFISGPPPIASPTDTFPRDYMPTGTRQPGRVATALGHFLWFGFLGQIAFTLSLFVIPSGSRGAVNHTSMPAEQWLYLIMCLPGLGAFGGAALSIWKPLSDLGQLLRIVLTVLAIGALFFVDLIGIVMWSWQGYC